MRIAILSDIHGNPIALDAVLHDLELHGGVDGYWILGDVVAIGHGPVQVLERLSELPNAHFVRGNTDRYVCTGDRPPPTLDEARNDPDLLQALVEVAATFAWTQGAITSAGWFDWLDKLPFKLRVTLPDGTRFLGIHASPGRDDFGIQPGFNQAEMERLLANCHADLICVGHTHLPMDVHVNGRRLVNVGSVSNPVLSDLRASYAILEAGGTGYEVELRRVDYDREAVIAAVQAIKHPGADFIIRHMRGQI